MDYESMTARQLQEECRRRGLPTARAKADMVQRLTDADATAADGSEDDFADGSVPEAPTTAPVNDTAEPEPVTPPPTAKPPAATPPGVVQLTFPAGPEGPDGTEHLANRQAVLQAARDAGWEPRGDAYRTGTVDGRHVYEVRVRQVP
jgi:hypothetical protein